MIEVFIAIVFLVTAARIGWRLTPPELPDFSDALLPLIAAFEEMARTAEAVTAALMALADALPLLDE